MGVYTTYCQVDEGRSSVYNMYKMNQCSSSKHTHLMPFRTLCSLLHFTKCCYYRIHWPKSTAKNSSWFNCTLSAYSLSCSSKRVVVENNSGRCSIYVSVYLFICVFLCLCVCVLSVCVPVSVRTVYFSTFHVVFHRKTPRAPSIVL